MSAPAPLTPISEPFNLVGTFVEIAGPVVDTAARLEAEGGVTDGAGGLAESFESASELLFLSLLPLLLPFRFGLAFPRTTSAIFHSATVGFGFGTPPPRPPGNAGKLLRASSGAFATVAMGTGS